MAGAVALGSFLVLLWTAFVAASGGGRLHLGPLVISSRSAVRPGILAAVLYAASLLLASASDRSGAWRWLRDCLERWWVLAALAAAGAVLWLGLTYGSYAVGGSDSFGYVTQAYLWLDGDLHVTLEPLASRVPWPFADESLTPLGYRPGPARHTMVPTYPPGLPLIMAGFLRVFGACGPYFVPPVFAGLLVILTYALTVRLSGDRMMAAIAAVCMAACPAFLYNLVVPMSDIVTAALWTGTVVILTWPGLPPALAAGTVAGIAVLVRPNLAPLAIAGALAAELWPQRRPRARTGIRALMFLAAVGAACLFVGVVNARLYGSPLLSGYGPASALYSVARFTRNSYLYASWLIESEGPVVVAALLPFVVRAMRPTWFNARTLLPLGVYALTVFLSYAFYLVFSDWWYLRFLLPVMPVLFMCVALPLAWLTRRLPAHVSVPALVTVMAILVSRWTGFVLARQVLDVGIGEQRTVTVADYVTRALPRNAILIAMHHVGPVRLYSGRPSLRFDYFAPPRLVSAIGWLRDNGYRPYILLEDWEERDYRRRFSDQGPVGQLTIPVIAEMKRPIAIRLYDPLGSPGAPSHPDLIVSPSVARCAEATWGK